MSKALHEEWTVRGHNIREAVGNDSVIGDVMRRHFPRYEGESLELYRGERRDRWLAHQIGFGWTTEPAKALMFARGLKNTSESGGGVLLKTVASSEAIISAPSVHSQYLGESEYLVDPRLIDDIDLVEGFNPPTAPPP